MRVLPLGVVCALCSGPLLAVDPIGNAAIVVQPRDESLELRDAGGDSSFVTELRLPWSVARRENVTVRDAVWGEGRAILVTHTNGWRTTISVFPSSPFAQVTTRVVHSGEEALDTASIEHATLVTRSSLPTERLRVVGTGGTTTVDTAQGSYTFSALADPESRRGVVSAWLTHERGIGVLFPALQGGAVATRSQIDFGRYRVEPGAERATETLLIGHFADARIGLEAYAESVARHYSIRLAEKPGVYCTWYHAGASNETALAANTEFAARELLPYGLSVMQIDDKWQRILPKGSTIDPKSIRTTGPIKVFADSNDSYPAGMAATAKRIVERGMVAGIWFMPFAGNLENPYFDPDVFARNPDGTPFHDARWSGTCIDTTHPKGEAFVRERVRRIHEWGYRYFKIDGMHTGMPSYNIYVNTSYRNVDFGKARLHDPGATLAEAYRKGLRILREEAPGTFILGCNVSQNMRSMGPAFGLIDAMRIGPDNGGASRGDWRQIVLGAWHGTNLYFLNGRVWHNDPDPVYVRPSNPIERARWMCSWMAVSGALHTSSEQYDRLPPERLELLKRCLPSHGLAARPVDYLETNEPRLWIVGDERLHIVGLFNWSDEEPAEIRYALGRMGLSSERTYRAFDFWADRDLAPLREELRQELPPGTCRVLALRPDSPHPVLLSTSRHITQGLVDVESESWSSATRTLSGRSHVVAGDRYELRIALPESGDWRLESAELDGAKLERSEREEPRLLRLAVVPKRSGLVSWSVRF